MWRLPMPPRNPGALHLTWLKFGSKPAWTKSTLRSKATDWKRRARRALPNQPSFEKTSTRLEREPGRWWELVILELIFLWKRWRRWFLGVVEYQQNTQKTHEIMKELNDGVQKLDGLSSDVVLWRSSKCTSWCMPVCVSNLGWRMFFRFQSKLVWSTLKIASPILTLTTFRYRTRNHAIPKSFESERQHFNSIWQQQNWNTLGVKSTTIVE